MFYYIGPWIIQNGRYIPPNGTIGCIDLRAIPEQSNLDGNGYGFFCANQPLGSGYILLASQDFRSTGSTILMRDTFHSLLGYRPQGNTLSDLIVNILTDGSHPDGDLGVKSLLPTNNHLIVAMANHGTFYKKAFSPSDRHFSKVRDVLQNSYRKIHGKNTSDEIHRKYLATLGSQFNITDPENYFIPNGMKKEKPLKPSTAFIETFPTNAGNLTSAQDLTWSANPTDYTVSSNQLRLATSSTETSATLEAQHNLSSDNMSCRMDIITFNSPSGGEPPNMGVMVRVDLDGTDDWYTYQRFHNNDSSEDYGLDKSVGGTPTNLIVPTTMNNTILGDSKLQIFGSLLTLVGETTHTDTSLTGQLSGGIDVGTETLSTAGDLILDDVLITDYDGIGRYLPLKGNNNKFNVWKLHP